MNRKEFIRNTALIGSGLGLVNSTSFSQAKAKRKSGKVLNAYYFRAHMYTLVPRHVQEDMKWMADAGTNVVSIAVLEQDFYAAKENIEIICNEAAKLGMDVWAVPSRWGGLVAGAPKVPSDFTIKNPETWKKNKDGSYAGGVAGRISSIFHPATYEFMRDSAKRLFETWDFKGLIWDEPKSLGEDYHELAIKELGNGASREQFLDANVQFYSKINNDIKADYPDKTIAMFIYSNFDDMAVEKCATIDGLDVYGCDGRPWRNEDGGKQEGQGKVLLGGVGQRFLDAATANKKKSLWLVENHNMSDKDIPLLEKGLPEVVKTDVDHLIYYYYPRNLSQPDKIMNVIKKNISDY